MTKPSVTLVIEPLAPPSIRPLRTIFEEVCHTDMAVLFDSASEHSDSRYSIMAWSPKAWLTTRQGESHIRYRDSELIERVTSPPFTALKNLHHALVSTLSIAGDSQRLADELPFLIGVAGLAGYDTGRYYEALPTEAEDDYDCPDVVVGLYDQSLIEDRVTGMQYHCRLDYLPRLDLSGIDAKPETGRFALASRWVSNLSKQAYVNALERINTYLHTGDCYQVNMAQRFTAAYTGDPFTAYCRLRDSNKAPFSAYLHHQGSHVLSISPERFLSVSKDGQVQTKPIKGTRPRFADPARDKASANELLEAEKDQAENLMIVDLLRNDISKHCEPHSVAVPALFSLESFAAVHHLVSTITARLSADASPLDLLAGAFPGGSITGAPKVRAMEIIDELEPHRRNVYCGSMFYLGAMNDMDSSICIRTLLAENNRIHCWAGGGIVLDSDPLSEYQETLDKVAKILPELAEHCE
ncbi:aminodeoxychorismate synthase component I [Alteromonas halophila]|uniref:aminodeoxychorismate synthase n=1 Tax=Alteromonas halophila TaxID=516698 RepID=A0A918JLP2_9ALTE|nr:aminodeoxychorismate synthase component I [Alteromonas halophila]GGW88394.1 aminodeoxychorismate synthase, component I [Alteromonas halophila]